MVLLTIVTVLVLTFALAAVTTRQLLFLMFQLMERSTVRANTGRKIPAEEAQTVAGQ